MAREHLPGGVDVVLAQKVRLRLLATRDTRELVRDDTGTPPPWVQGGGRMRYVYVKGT